MPVGRQECNDGDVATSTCPHGFAVGSCLICQTLGSPATATRTSRPPVERIPAGSVEVLARAPRRRSLKARLAVWGITAVAVVLGVIWALTLVWAVLRLIEVAGVAVLSAYVAWKLGVRHGRRHPAER